MEFSLTILDLAGSVALLLVVLPGGHLGTPLIVPALPFNVAAASPLLVLGGFIVFQRATGGCRDFGRRSSGWGRDDIACTTERLIKA